MAIVWKEEYNTGESEVDKQHKVLFKYLEDLEDHMKAADINDHYIKMLLDNLGIFTRSHFCYEEICMRRMKCPAAAENKMIHGKLLTAYGSFLKRFEIEGVSDDLIQKLHDFLESWLVNHILKIDVQMRDCV
ncbi:MAG: hemerythrin family protein [Mariprofundaceae bacterium]|nr:hemerythrin family protein [Mariprofundaceae bacterium]